jgi:hypothetical protein
MSKYYKDTSFLQVFVLRAQFKNISFLGGGGHIKVFLPLSLHYQIFHLVHFLRKRPGNDVMILKIWRKISRFIAETSVSFCK